MLKIDVGDTCERRESCRGRELIFFVRFVGVGAVSADFAKSAKDSA